MWHLGFSDVHFIDGRNDQGADILAVRDREQWVVQCKWSSRGPDRPHRSRRRRTSPDPVPGRPSRPGDQYRPERHRRGATQGPRAGRCQSRCGTARHCKPSGTACQTGSPAPTSCACGPCAAPAPTPVSCARPCGAPSPLCSLSSWASRSSCYPARARRSSSARSAVNDSRSAISSPRKTAFSVSFASITAHSRATSSRCSPAPAGRPGASDTVADHAQPQSNVQASRVACRAPLTQPSPRDTLF